MLALGLLLVLQGCHWSTDPVAREARDQPSAVDQMRDAMRQGDWQRASEHAQQALIASPGDADLITDAAKIAAFNGQKRDAAQMLVDAATMADYQPASRVDFAVRALIEVGELYKAIDLLEKTLQAKPDYVMQRRILVGFLAEAQRTELISPHFQALIRARSFDVNLLAAITETTSRRLSHKTPARLMERNPSDHRVRLGEAREILDQHDADAARDILQDILEHHPDFAPAHAMLGQVLIEQRRLEALPQWIESAPLDSIDYAEYWLTLGDWAAESQQHAQAARAYWEATQRDPNNSPAWTRLARMIRQLAGGDPQDASLLSRGQLRDIDLRIENLLELRKRFYGFEGSGQTSQSDATKVAETLLSLGRTWEAEAWSALATTLTEDRSDTLDSLRKKILRALQQDASWLSSNGHPALAVDLSHLPPPSIRRAPELPPRKAVVPMLATTDHLRLSEESAQWGLAGVAAKSNPTDARLAALIRSTGVGGGTIDYDLDGWPDFLVMGAGGTMLEHDSMPNDLMRNTGHRFVKVTQWAGVNDTGFGQGVAVGDFNEDGFPDLFFANLGTNRLLRNNGDGTFTDCTDTLHGGGQKEQWSTSAAFMDINADGFSDLLLVNYCDTNQPLDEPCLDSDGHEINCHPLVFPADGDQLFLATPTGTLEDVSSQWIPAHSPGRGLGILAGTMDAQNFGAFVANDMSSNFYYTLTEGPSLDESASVRGVAMDGRNLAQASMGIASSDFDGDGDLDLYVTGFGQEYNIYYEQIAPGLWKDETSRLNLVRDTLSLVGFGTEAIDFDNDGVDEIIVTNGHIGQFEKLGSLPYEQPLQLFRRDAEGKFALLDDDSWGDYFTKPHVGKALWTIDVNRDGNSDVLITHSYEQLRLLVNRTEQSNDQVAFKLVGTDVVRDAVGAIVRFECNQRKRTLWALAGDGYMCSNERVLRAGLGQAEEVNHVTVTWQDGSVEKFGTLSSNAEYLIVQGEGTAFVLDQY